MNFIKNYKNGISIALHVQPRASRTKIMGIHGEALKLAVQAPPVDGEANAAICEFFADFFSCAKRNIEILSGETGRKKSVFILGIAKEDRKSVV